MIIHSIHAHNVLKYEHLELNDLPAQGVIAISGYNESGKSTIGETICFALFGRTFSIHEQDLGKIIRWGESDCNVTLQFSNSQLTEGSAESSQQRYVLTRMLDCDGNHSAKLYQLGHEDEPIARGIERVEEAIFDLTAIEYEEFIESFYLAQREITTPHPHSYALKTMAGIATMEHCDNSIHSDIEQNEEDIESLSEQVEQINEDIETLAIEAEKLDSLGQELDELTEKKSQADNEYISYQADVDDYLEATPKRKKVLKKKGRASFGHFIFLLLSVMTFALWWVLIKMPDSNVNLKATQLIQDFIPQINVQYFSYLLYISGATTFLFFLFFMLAGKHKGNSKRLAESGIRLADKIQVLSSQRSEEDAILVNLIARSHATQSQLERVIAPDIAYYVEQQEQCNEQMQQLSQQVEIERERVRQFAEYQATIADTQTQIEEKQARNEIRELAMDLLIGASRHLSKRFNHIIREHVGKTLPLFTEDRYEHLQIDDDLSVRVFSNEKHDFMDLDEISSGTSRQIMLAVRLALSQEMVSRKVQNQQFLILDEPFAFFDEQRTQRSLQVLPQLSNDLSQIWVIAQSFPEELHFEQSIFCQRDRIIQTNNISS